MADEHAGSAGTDRHDLEDGRFYLAGAPQGRTTSMPVLIALLIRAASPFCPFQGLRGSEEDWHVGGYSEYLVLKYRCMLFWSSTGTLRNYPGQGKRESA